MHVVHPSLLLGRPGPGLHSEVAFLEHGVRHFDILGPKILEALLDGLDKEGNEVPDTSLVLDGARDALGNLNLLALSQVPGAAALLLLGGRERTAWGGGTSS